MRCFLVLLIDPAVAFLASNMEVDFQNPPLFTACMQGNLEAVQLLLWSPDYITDINEDRGYIGWGTDEYYNSEVFAPPLWAAAVGGHYDIVRFLIESGANINATSNSGSTSLHSACDFGSISIIKFLVENGADVNLPGWRGFTCLMIAAKNQNLKIKMYRVFE